MGQTPVCDTVLDATWQTETRLRQCRLLEQTRVVQCLYLSTASICVLLGGYTPVSEALTAVSARPTAGAIRAGGGQES